MSKEEWIEQKGRLEELIGVYWDIAYQEGHSRRPDGSKIETGLQPGRTAHFCGALRRMAGQFHRPKHGQT